MFIYINGFQYEKNKENMKKNRIVHCFQNWKQKKKKKKKLKKKPRKLKKKKSHMYKKMQQKKVFCRPVAIDWG